MADKKTNVHICSICNKEHSTIAERIRCEYNCLQKLEAEEAKKKREDQEKKKTAKINEIKEQIKMMEDNRDSLYREYVVTSNKIADFKAHLRNLETNKLNENIFTFPIFW